MPWSGYNFEDSILISERMVQEDTYTTIHIEELSCVARDTKLGSEEITRDIPNVGEAALSKLDESGIVYIGAEVMSGDILVGKVTPKGETQLTPEEKLLRAIFGEKASDVKDTSLRMPSGMSGTVIDVQVFTRDGVEKDARAKQNEDQELARVRKDLNDQFRIVEEDAYDRIEKLLTGRTAEGGPGELKGGDKVSNLFNGPAPGQVVRSAVAQRERQRAVGAVACGPRMPSASISMICSMKSAKLEAGDDLAPGVLKMVKAFVAVKRRLQPGDKMAGRHGNKGVISKDHPGRGYALHGRRYHRGYRVEPSGRAIANECGSGPGNHLGWAAHELGRQIDTMLSSRRKMSEVRKVAGKDLQPQRACGKHQIPETTTKCWNWPAISAVVCRWLRRCSMAPSKKRSRACWSWRSLPTDGQARLRDGRTGEPFDRPITVGYMYMLKLNHLVDDKMHARSTGPYSLITQQPLGGKAQFGGQRFGEMEVWALEAYGASYTLQEMLTVKSDDVAGRTKMYENIVRGDHYMEANMPESFNVLMKEIRSLGLNIELKHD